jgi:hypothetical protein
MTPTILGAETETDEQPPQSSEGSSSDDTATQPTASTQRADTDTGPAIGEPFETTPEKGYQGLWIGIGPEHPQFGFRLGAGIATYSPFHRPQAVYDPESDKTFFVYLAQAGIVNESPKTPKGSVSISCFDHAAGMLERPRSIVKQQINNPNDGPALTIDDDGHLWVFATSHRREKPSRIYRSVKPRDLNEFELVVEMEFAFPQPWYLPSHGFVLLHTRYVDGKPKAFVTTSETGRKWSEARQIIAIGQGQYFISQMNNGKIGLAFAVIPEEHHIGQPTNLYYIETPDGGNTWKTVRGKKVELPIDADSRLESVREYEDMNRLVFLKDLDFGPRGRPVALFMLTHIREKGPRPRSRVWNTGRWTGGEWEVTGPVRSDSDDDHGCFHVDKLIWRLIAPTIRAPLESRPGGEMVMWTSEDYGRSWQPLPLTRESQFNHNNARCPIDAQPDFFAYWSDGHSHRPNLSTLYFADINGNVFRMPVEMDSDAAKPELVWPTLKPPEPTESEQQTKPRP